MINILLFLLGTILLILCLIVLIRIVFSILLVRAYNKYKKLKKAVKNKIRPDKKDFIKEDEELLKYKETLPKAHSAVKAQNKLRSMSNENYELIESDLQRRENQELAEVKIVDLVKPVGFWTSMILGQKLTYLVSAAQIINNRSQRGFWVSMIEAKERAAGKERGRGL